MSDEPESKDGKSKGKRKRKRESAENDDRLCLKCGKPGGNHFVMTGDHAMKGPYHKECQP